MTKKKGKIAFIPDDTARKTTYKKRKKGIIKKVSELTILCGIPACAIISSSFESKPEVWPDPVKAKQMIDKYLNEAVLDQNKNINRESFIRQRIDKAHDQLKKLRQENCNKEMTLSVFQYMQGKDLPNNVEELKKLDKLIQKNKKSLENKMVAFNC